MRIIYFYNIICAAMLVCANVILKNLLERTKFGWSGDMRDFCTQITTLAIKPLFWVGVALFLLANILWLSVLATQKLSIAYPLQISLVFMFSTLASLLVFGEKLSSASIAGLALVVCGVVLITKG